MEIFIWKYHKLGTLVKMKIITFINLKRPFNMSAYAGIARGDGGLKQTWSSVKHFCDTMTLLGPFSSMNNIIIVPYSQTQNNILGIKSPLFMTLLMCVYL